MTSSYFSMEPSSGSSSRFRFRDHEESEARSDFVSELSSDSSDYDDEEEDDDDDYEDDDDLDSMTGKGIQLLCSELEELKLASNEEFHNHIVSNSTVFIRIFEEADRLENELEQLKSHFLAQKELVKGLVGITCSEALSEEAIGMIIEEFEPGEVRRLSELEDRLNNVSEILDVLLIENRIEVALDVVDLEEEKFRIMQFEENCSLADLRFYSSVIFEMKAGLILKLTQFAENPRIRASELQKALLGLCRLGETLRAVELVLEYYDTRIVKSIHHLQMTRSSSDDFYARELSQIVFSLISQAATSFVSLDGEASPYMQELVKWAQKTTKAYVDCLNQYLKSVSDLSGGLALASQAVQISMSFCALLETRGMVLRPYLVQQIGPAVGEVLLENFEHLKKVIGAFIASDSWVLGKYLVAGITNEGCYSTVLGQETECCVLTSSGRKFARLIKTITEDATPLFSLQMEGSVLGGIKNLFKEYLCILESILFNGSVVTKDDVLRNNLAESLQQQISILANLSALNQLLPRMIKRFSNSDNTDECAFDYQQKEIDAFTLYVDEALSQIRIRFCLQYVTRIMSLQTSCKPGSKTGNTFQDDASMEHVLTPSVAFQTLFLELRKIGRLVEDYGYEKEWLLEILRELVETIFNQISSNKDFWMVDDDNATLENPAIYAQLVLDVQFLGEIANFGGYFSNTPRVLEDLMESALFSVGKNSEKDVDKDDYLLEYVNKVILKLLEVEKSTMLPNDEPIDSVGNDISASDSAIHDDNVGYFSDDSTDLCIDIPATIDPETCAITNTHKNSSDNDVGANPACSSTGHLGVVRAEEHIFEAEMERYEHNT